MSFESDAAIAFAMYADTSGLTREEGLALAERVGEAIQAAAGDREHAAADLQGAEG